MGDCAEDCWYEDGCNTWNYNAKKKRCYFFEEDADEVDTKRMNGFIWGANKCPEEDYQ